jgi:hypothetical protein
MIHEGKNVTELGGQFDVVVADLTLRMKELFVTVAVIEVTSMHGELSTQKVNTSELSTHVSYVNIDRTKNL